MDLAKRVTQLLGELRIADQHTGGALAVLHVGQQGVRLGQRRIQVVVERLILEQLAGRTLSAVERSGDTIELFGRGVEPVVHGVVRHQFADGTTTVVEIDFKSVQFVDCGVSLVVEVGIVDELPDRPLAPLQVIYDRIHLRKDDVKLLDRALAGLDDVRDAWRFKRVEFIAVLERGTGSDLTVDVHDGVTEHPDGGERGLGVFLQVALILRVQLHHHLDRGQLACRIGRDRDALDRANRYSLQVDCPSLFNAGSIFKVGRDSELFGQDAKSRIAGHQEKQGHQDYGRN